ncbi:MAG: hypothetical protein IJ526_13690, partial [Lachnospiraceae bacterium]|nr:hypothetical protein [Lachnospiraceae bacterium]
MNSIKEIIFSQAQIALEELEEKGYIEGGFNGPYHDQETPLRVCSHWIRIFGYCNQINPSYKYNNAVVSLAEYIVEQQYPNGTFLCRSKEGKDRTNGLIGLAWIIEGLVAASEITKDKKYYLAGKRAFFSQIYDMSRGLWIRVDIDNRVLGIDTTYNHQLWFAAAGGLLFSFDHDYSIGSTIRHFLEHSFHTFKVYDNGLISHFVYCDGKLFEDFQSIKRYIKEVILRRNGYPSMKYKEEGYHYFNMYGFAVLHSVFPDHPFFRS